jgi:signal peptidase I
MILLPVGPIGLLAMFLAVAACWILIAFDAYSIARRNGFAHQKRYQRLWVYVLFVLATGATAEELAFLARTYLFEAFEVPGNAMAPTIVSGDRILVDKLRANKDRVRRNDVVVFASDGPGSSLYIMRVIGLPGERLQIENEQVYIDDSALVDDHAAFTGPVPPIPGLVDYGPVTIPDDCFFALGDNRRRSNDSRLLGPIPLDDFYAKAHLVFWSHEIGENDLPPPASTTLSRIRWGRIGARLD